MNILKIIGIAAGAAVAGIAGLAIMNPNNAAQTSVDNPDAALRTRRYQTDLQTFTSETKTLIPTISTYGQDWKVISSEMGAGNSASIRIEVPVVIFTDDLEIKADFDAEKGEVIVNIHSNSRVGKSDLGENRRHILQILEALDKWFVK
ncbi:MAG TPA: DUF1499 domain-containing protein [Pyrinomonadaceae bacterium]|nr:DUF1499 domain-containing protein [Pyrinomonadaceae bacterium]